MRCLPAVCTQRLRVNIDSVNQWACHKQRVECCAAREHRNVGGERERARERESFIRNNVHNGAVALGERERVVYWTNKQGEHIFKDPLF